MRATSFVSTRAAAAIGSHGTARFGGATLPRPAAVVLLYTGHSDLAASEPPTFVAVGETDGIAPPAVMERRVAEGGDRRGVPPVSSRRSWLRPGCRNERRGLDRGRGSLLGQADQGHITGRTRPFAETKELVAGFWIWQVRSMEEAIEWAKRCPNPMPGPSDLEIRPIWESEDFGPEIAAGVNELRAKIAKNTK
jgi:hypothetical protein